VPAGGPRGDVHILTSRKVLGHLWVLVENYQLFWSTFLLAGFHARTGMSRGVSMYAVDCEDRR
jgi:hypothetical protein